MTNEPTKLLASTRQNIYIWSCHCIHKDVGWRLFDHKKPIVVASCFNVVASYFCWLSFHFYYFLLLFLPIVTFVNYFILLKWVSWIVLNYFLIFQGGKGVVWFLKKTYYYWRGRGFFSSYTHYLATAFRRT